MNYVYDVLIDKEHNLKTLDRYGVRYKFEKKFVMGDRLMYSFVSSSKDKILVVPQFIQQYNEIQKKLNANRGTSYEACLRWVTRNVNKDVSEDTFPSEDSSTGSMNVIIALYKDISLTFEYFDNKMRLARAFEILANNLFGNPVFVDLTLLDV